jgi:3-oxoacyl-[acyl-carrier protein] reductase
MSLTGKTVLCTGAAGGLGTEACLIFLAAGARVVAIDIDAEKIRALAEKAHSRNLTDLVPQRFDLSDLDGLRALLETLSSTVGGFDVVVNNAAIYPRKPFQEYALAEHQAVQTVNVEAAIVCVQAALPHMRERAWGRIINLTSIVLYGGWADLSPYVQSKGALMGLTRAWAREFGAWGITVNAVSPGALPTDAEKIHPDPEAYARFVLDHQAVKRRGDAGDIANTLMFFASEQAGFITGQSLNVDGGWVMQ